MVRGAKGERRARACVSGRFYACRVVCRLAAYTLWGATPPPPELRGCAPELPNFRIDKHHVGVKTIFVGIHVFGGAESAVNEEVGRCAYSRHRGKADPARFGEYAVNIHTS